MAVFDYFIKNIRKGSITKLTFNIWLFLKLSSSTSLALKSCFATASIVLQNDDSSNNRINECPRPKIRMVFVGFGLFKFFVEATLDIRVGIPSKQKK